jgi:hypothetical protein
VGVTEGSPGLYEAGPPISVVSDAHSGSKWRGMGDGAKSVFQQRPLDIGIHGCHGRGIAGQSAAALVHLVVCVLDGRAVGTAHGHSLLMDPAFLAAGALVFHGLGLHGVPADTAGQPVSPRLLSALQQILGLQGSHQLSHLSTVVWMLSEHMGFPCFGLCGFSGSL